MNPLKKPNSFEEKLKKQLEASEWKPSDALWDRIEQNMQANSFEPKLQEKLSDFTVKPSEEVWEKVASQLPETHKKRGFLWFTSLALITMLSFGVGYFFKQIHSNEETQLANRIENPKVEKENPKVEIENSMTTSSSRPEPKLAAHANATKEHNQTLPVLEPKVESKALIPQALVQTEVKTKVKLAGVIAGKRSHTKKSSANGLAKGFVIAGSNNPSLAAIPPSEPAKQVNEILGKTDVAQAIPANSDKEMRAPLPGPKEILSSKNVAPSAADTFSGEQVFRGNTYLEPEESFTQFSITAMGGMHQSFIMLAKPSGNKYDLDKSFALRNETDQAAFDFSGAFMVDYHVGKSWMVSAGIGITSFTQSVKFNVAPANQTNPNRVQPANLYMHPSDSIMAGSSNSLESKYSFTEIPIQLSYLFKSDGNFQFGLAGGFSYGRLNLVNAYITDPNCIGLLLVSDKNAFPKFKDVFFASFAPSVSMRLNGSTSVGLMPQFKIALHNMVDNPDWIQQRPALVGLNVFLRKRF